MAYYTVRGISSLKIFKKELIEEALDYEPRDDDVILVSYPRTGTILMSFIIQQIITNGEFVPDPNIKDILFKVVPFSFYVGAAGLDKIKTKPRVYKHHFALNQVKYNPKSKIIYIYRRPEDNVISRYYFQKDVAEIQYGFDEYFEKYMRGDVTYGGYFDHILSYLKIKGTENVLFVSYEKLILNKKQEILRIARFLDEKYHDNLVNDESSINNVLKNTDFEYMKKSLPAYVYGDHYIKINFFRKGKIGDGKLSLSDDQCRRLRDLANEKLAGTELISEWYP